MTQGVGDETGLGWAGRLANRINKSRELTWFNLGVRGDTSLELSRRVEAELQARMLVAPAEVWTFLSIGTNDASLFNGVPRVPTQRFLQLVERTLDVIIPLGKVFWIGPVPVARERLDLDFGGETFSFVTQLIAELSDGYSRLARAQSIPYLDLVEQFAGLDLSAHETADGVHPMSAGYREMFDIIERWEEIQRALNCSGG